MPRSLSSPAGLRRQNTLYYSPRQPSPDRTTQGARRGAAAPGDSRGSAARGGQRAPSASNTASKPSSITASRRPSSTSRPGPVSTAATRRGVPGQKSAVSSPKTGQRRGSGSVQKTNDSERKANGTSAKPRPTRIPSPTKSPPTTGVRGSSSTSRLGQGGRAASNKNGNTPNSAGTPGSPRTSARSNGGPIGARSASQGTRVQKSTSTSRMDQKNGSVRSSSCSKKGIDGTQKVGLRSAPSSAGIQLSSSTRCISKARVAKTGPNCRLTKSESNSRLAKSKSTPRLAKNGSSGRLRSSGGSSGLSKDSATSSPLESEQEESAPIIRSGVAIKTPSKPRSNLASRQPSRSKLPSRSTSHGDLSPQHPGNREPNLANLSTLSKSTSVISHDSVRAARKGQGPRCVQGPKGGQGQKGVQGPKGTSGGGAGRFGFQGGSPKSTDDRTRFLYGANRSDSRV